MDMDQDHGHVMTEMNARVMQRMKQMLQMTVKEMQLKGKIF